MKQINIYHISCALALSLLWGCSDDVTDKVDTVDSGQKEIRLQADIDQLNLSRADDSGFADGDRIGIYAVNFGADGNPGTLASTGNLADNVRFTFNEDANSWTGDRQLYFKDESTPVDFYGYYPYMEAVDNVNAYPFSVARNQSTEASDGRLSGYEASDFLWGKTVGVTPSTPIVTVTFRHILSSVQVTLIEGEGFDEGEWASLDKSVIVSGTGRDALIDLATGTATLTGSRDNTGIIAAGYKENYRAVVIPQSVDAGEPLLDITVDGQSYQFRKTETMTYVPSKMHKFTIEVTKRLPDGTFCFDIVNEAITPWESDAESHNGLAKEYLLVNIEENQTLEEALKVQKIDVSDIVNLKITGSMHSEDFYFIRDNMKKIQALNLREIDLKDRVWIGGESEYCENAIPSIALTNAVTLKYLVLPKKLTAIGEYAFGGTSLEGSLTIPDGVKIIEAGAFQSFWDEGSGYSVIPGGKLFVPNNFTGELSLPTSLEYIGSQAFKGCNFTGTLVLPESVTYIGEGAFCRCLNFTGELRLPDKLVETKGGFDGSNGAFYGMKGINGKLYLPKKMKVIGGFGNMELSSVLFPDAPVTIDVGAFRDTKIKAAVIIPPTVNVIEEYAFSHCTTPYVDLPQSLSFIGKYAFQGCQNLTDTIHIPGKVEVIEEGTFRECGKLKAVTLSSALTKICQMAFENCYALEYIRIDALVPPELDESAFYGVNKDNFTLEVPEQSVEAYRNAPGWREFRRIAAYRNFVARPSKYNVLNRGGKKEIILNADAEWELASAPSWCHVDKSSGNKKTEMMLTVDEMAHNSGNREGKVEFRLKGDAGYTTTIDVAQYDYQYEEDEYITLQHATKGDGIDLFFVGDGYDGADISDGSMLEDIRQEVEYFFAVEPYTTYREYFNVYTAVALSEDSGVEGLNHWRNTKFHTKVPEKCSDPRITADWGGAMDYCAEVCPPIINRPQPRVGVVLLANTALYDGVTYSMGDSFCALVTKSENDYPYDARGLVQHEAGGHGIGWLGDEYIYHPEFIQKCDCKCCGHVEELLAEQSSGFSLNLSLNGKYREVPWSHLIFNSSYGDIVDIYEGGYFHGRGVYRSEYNSCMNNNVPYFSTWSRQLIVQRIMKLAGEEFSLESFYANDSRETGRDFTSTSRSSNGGSAAGYHGNAPVFIDNYKFGRKGDRR